MKKLPVFCLSFIALGLLAAAAQACPSCSEAVSRNGADLSAGFARSIAVLMSAPYLLFAGLTFWIVRAVRRRGKNAA